MTERTIGKRTVWPGLLVVVAAFSLLSSAYHLFVHDADLLTTLLGQGNPVLVATAFAGYAYYAFSRANLSKKQTMIAYRAVLLYAFAGTAAAIYAVHEALSPVAALSPEGILFQATYVAAVGGIVGVHLGRSAGDREQLLSDVRDERNQTAALFENTTDAVAKIRIDGGTAIFEDVNDGFERTFGYDTDEISGADPEALAPAAKTDEMADHIDRVLAGEQFEAVVERQTADGSVKTFRGKAVPVETTGTATVAYVTYTDISQEERFIDQLAQLQKHTREIGDALDEDAIARRTVEAAETLLGFDLAVVYTVDNAEETLEPYALSEVVSEYFDEAPACDIEGTPPGDAYLTGRQVLCETAADLHLKLGENTPISSAIFQPLGEDAMLAVTSTDEGAFHERDERLVELLATAYESAANRADRERERLQGERRFEAVVDDPDLLVGRLTPDGTLVDANHTALDIAGVPEAAVVGERFWETPWWSDSDVLQTNVRQWVERAAAGEYVEYEAEHPSTDGDTVAVNGKFRPVKDDDGTVESIVVTAKDITETKRRKEALEALNGVTKDLMDAQTEQEIADWTIDAVRPVLDKSVAGFWSYDAADDTLRPSATTDQAGELIGESPSYHRGDSLAWRAFQSGEVAVYNDLPDEPGRYNRNTTIGSEVVLPLEEFGILIVSSPETGAFDDIDASLAQLLADTVESALQRANREQQIRTQREKLEEQRDQFGALFENTTDAVMEVRFENGAPVISDVNPTFEDIFGYDADAIVGTSPEVLAPDSDRETMHDHAEQVLGNEQVEAVVERQLADGSTKPFRGNAIPVRTSGDDTIAYVSYTDISEEQQFIDQLTQLNEYARESMATTDSEALAERTLEAAISVAGYDHASILSPGENDEAFEPRAVSEAVAELYDTDTQDAIVKEDVLERVTRTERPLYIEDVSRFSPRAAAETSLTNVILHPLGDESVLAVASDEDISDSRNEQLIRLLAMTHETATSRAEREAAIQEQNERLDEFAGVVSHDLRNPLTAAKGYLELGRETDDPERFDTVEEQLDRMDTLIDDLLTLAKEGHSVDESSVLALDTVVRDAWQSTTEMDGTPELDVDPAAETVSITGEETRVQELLENLFRNAVGHGGGDVTVRVGPTDDGFYVEDDGPGIPPEERETVFEHGHTTSADGTGFGLAIVDQIADAHGWTISVTEGDLGGARFEIAER